MAHFAFLPRRDRVSGQMGRLSMKPEVAATRHDPRPTNHMHRPEKCAPKQPDPRRQQRHTMHHALTELATSH
jgi:hypothetical protein